jgi:hypothetical protein
MIIVRLLLPSLLVGFATTNFTPGAGADIVMESITLIDRIRASEGETLEPGR